MRWAGGCWSTYSRGRFQTDGRWLLATVKRGTLFSFNSNAWLWMVRRANSVSTTTAETLIRSVHLTPLEATTSLLTTARARHKRLIINQQATLLPQLQNKSNILCASTTTGSTTLQFAKKYLRKCFRRVRLVLTRPACRRRFISGLKISLIGVGARPNAKAPHLARILRMSANSGERGLLIVATHRTLKKLIGPHLNGHKIDNGNGSSPMLMLDGARNATGTVTPVACKDSCVRWDACIRDHPKK